MKLYTALAGATILSFCVSGAFADGGIVNARASFTIIGEPKCVPVTPQAFTFNPINNQTMDISHSTLAAQTLTLTNCAAGTVVNIRGTRNMEPLMGAGAITTATGVLADVIGVEILAAPAGATAKSSSILDREGNGVDVVLVNANSISLYAILRNSHNFSEGGLKAIPTGDYTIEAPLTVNIK